MDEKTIASIMLAACFLIVLTITPFMMRYERKARQNRYDERYRAND